MMGSAAGTQPLVSHSGRALLPAPPAIRSRFVGPTLHFGAAHGHIAATGATATRVLEPLVAARRPPPGQQAQQEPLSPRAAMAVAQAQRAAEDSEAWKSGAFPAYLQSEVDDFCAAWDDALQEQVPSDRSDAEDPFWKIIQREAAEEARSEPLLSSFLHASVVSHDSFARSLAFVLANRLEDPTLHSTELSDIFHTVLRDNPDVREAAIADIIAFRERDPACRTYTSALLNYKGYHAIQAHRIAHILWNSGRQMMALALQSRVSEVLAIDIHPGARIGKGVLMDHGTGVVIGETAVVENNVSIMQNVTLGGTGKNAGDRHPKVEANVLLGAGATVLGNITIGKGAQVAANSLVLKPVPPKAMVAGSPAREVGKVTGNPALKMQHWLKPASSEEAAREEYSSSMARKPDPFSAAATAPSGAHLNGSSPSSSSDDRGLSAATQSGSAPAEECQGDMAGWALDSISKALSSSGSSSSSSSSRSNSSHSSPSGSNRGGRTAWQRSSSSSPAASSSQGASSSTQQRSVQDASTRVENPEPWVHQGAAGSAAEALARATLRNASASNNAVARLQQHQQNRARAAAQIGQSSGGADAGYWQTLRATLEGHTHDESSQSDDEQSSDISGSWSDVKAELELQPPRPPTPAAVVAASPDLPDRLGPVASNKVSKPQSARSKPAAQPTAALKAFPQQTPYVADDADYMI